MNPVTLLLVLTSVAAFWLQLAGFVAVSRATRSYASEQLSGDSKRARHTILPAWRPLLVGKCYVLFVAAAAATAAAASLIACHAIGAWGAWAWADAAALVGVADAALVPAVVAQDAVTVRAFRRAVALPLLALVIQLGPWAGRYFTSTESSRVAASAVLVVAGGLAPLAASLLILTGRVPSRVRLRSRTHRAAFVLHAALAFGFALSLGLRLVDACVEIKSRRPVLSPQPSSLGDFHAGRRAARGPRVRRRRRRRRRRGAPPHGAHPRRRAQDARRRYQILARPRQA